MKYHKIRNVSKEVCTAEQKIAYNLAFRAHINFQEEFDRVNAVHPGGARSDCTRLAHREVESFRRAHDYKPGQYDDDAIFSALLAGLYDYMCRPFIATSYEQIGKAFPAQYL